MFKNALLSITLMFASSFAFAEEAAEANPKTATVTLIEHEDTWGFRVDGIISEDFGRQIDAAIAESNSRGIEPKFFELNSEGGLHNEAKVVAGLIHLTRSSTIVREGDKCSSSCLILLMAGKEREIQNGATIGVHQHKVFGMKDGMTESEAVYEIMMDYFRFAAIGSIDAHLIGFMASIKHDSIASLPRECAIQMNLDNVTKVGGESCAYESANLFPILGNKPYGSITIP